MRGEGEAVSQFLDSEERRLTYGLEGPSAGGEGGLFRDTDGDEPTSGRVGELVTPLRCCREKRSLCRDAAGGEPGMPRLCPHRLRRRSCVAAEKSDLSSEFLFISVTGLGRSVGRETE